MESHWEKAKGIGRGREIDASAEPFSTLVLFLGTLTLGDKLPRSQGVDGLHWSRP
jgi:hypothetical protein